MRARVVDIEQVAHVNFRQTAVDSKLIVVLAQAAYHIVHMVAGRIFFAQHRDVVIRAIHRRTHQIAGARIHADIFLISMFFMAGGRHQRAVRTKYKAPQLSEDRHVAHSRGHKHLFKRLSHAFPDGRNVVGRFIRPIRNAHARRKG